MEADPLVGARNEAKKKRHGGECDDTGQRTRRRGARPLLQSRCDDGSVRSRKERGRGGSGGHTGAAGLTTTARYKRGEVGFKYQWI